MKFSQTLQPVTSPLRDIAGGVVLSGLGPILVRESPVGPAATAFWRFVLAAPVAFRCVRAGERLPPRALGWALFSGLLLGGDIVLWNRAILTTSVMEASVLVMIYPFLVAVGGWALFREKLTSGMVLGALGAFFGIALMSAEPSASQSSVLGNALALIAAVFYAGSLLATARLCRAHPPALVTAWSVLGAALTALPFGILEGGYLPQDLGGWSFIFAYGGVTVASYLLVARGLKKVPAALAAIMGFGMPLIGTALSAILYREIPGPLDFAGAGLILAGIAIAVRPNSARVAA